MPRCAALALALALALSASVAQAQSLPRKFPADALRAEMRMLQPPSLELAGHAARLAPGARVRGTNNLIVTPASIAGQTLTVHYTVDFGGQVKDVWLLRAEELAREPWPRTPEQAASWRFDPQAQTWSKP